MFNKKRFSQLLKTALGERTTTVYADITGVNRTYISKLLNEKLSNPPSPEIIKGLSSAAYGGVTYEDFMAAAGYLQDSSSEPSNQKIVSAISDDPELLEFWKELTKREDLQLLFKQVKPMTPNGIKKVIRIIKAIEDEEAMED